MVTKQKTRIGVVSMVSLCALIACGGGGGGGDVGIGGGATQQPVTVTGTTGAQPIVTNVPAPLYAAGTEEFLAFNYLNAERSRCGFGKVAERIELNNAAQNHADWSLINNQYGHYQSASLATGFTGVTPGERARAAGYPSDAVTETLSGSLGIRELAGYGVESAKGLIAAPYHLAGMMSPNADVGISIRSVNSVTPRIQNGLSRVAIYDLGVINERYQVPEKSAVLMYPCDGSTNVNYEVRGEFPNPVPGRDLATNPIGHAILLMLPRGEQLTIIGSSMVNVSNNASVPMRAGITSSNDPNGLFQTIGGYVGYVVPDVALLPGTNYSVTVTGTSTGRVQICSAPAGPSCVPNGTGSFMVTSSFRTRL